MKKAQMEIMGLAIVVVLLVLGMLFMVKFVLFKPTESYRSEYTTTQLAANMINAILNTNTKCNDISISELLQDAAKDVPRISDCPDPYTSGDYVEEAVIELLNNTLGENGLRRDYRFYAVVGNLDNPIKVLVEVGEEPNDFNVRERKTHFLTSDVGIMTIVLDIYG